MSENDNFPVAEKQSSSARWFRGLSWMWMVTLACVSIAAGLIWFSIEPSGPEIIIHFGEGHGLKQGDALLYRGIEAGRVASVKLDPQLSRVDVHVELEPWADQLAREDSRFWIVRPQLDLTGISGLETAVGSKYIEVIPGESEVHQHEFEGLSRRPPGGLGEDGIEVILRGRDRYGLNPGTPLTWRGLEVGQVISSHLSADALHVDTRVRIMEPHRRLLSRDSKFWVTSGVRMDVGVTGFELITGTLDTFARGGVAFITSGGTSKPESVRPGDMFTLHEKPDDSWLASAAPLNLLKQPLPPIGTVVGTWQQKQFGFTREKSLHASGLTMDGVSGAVAVIPFDLVAPPDKAMPDSYALVYHTSNEESEIPLLSAARGENKPRPLTLIPIDTGEAFRGEHTPRERFRSPGDPEDCVVVRHSWRADAKDQYVTEAIELPELTQEGERWKISLDRFSRDAWHGAAVMAVSDEKVIGLLLVDDQGASVAPFPASLLP